MNVMRSIYFGFMFSAVSLTSNFIWTLYNIFRNCCIFSQHWKIIQIINTYIRKYINLRKWGFIVWLYLTQKANMNKWKIYKCDLIIVLTDVVERFINFKYISLQVFLSIHFLGFVATFLNFYCLGCCLGGHGR